MNPSTTLPTLAPTRPVDRYDSPACALPTGTLTVTLICASTLGQAADSVRLTNDTDQELDLRGWTLGSIAQPQADEPFALSGTVPAGAGLTLLSTGGAPPVLTRRKVFSNTAPGEGARLTTPYGTLVVPCTTGTANTGTLRVGGSATTGSGTAPGLPNTGGGGGHAQPSGTLAALFAALLIGIGAASGVIARLATRRRGASRE